MIYLVIFGLIVTAVVNVLPMLRRDRGLRERERFVTARHLTSTWASSADH